MSDNGASIWMNSGCKLGPTGLEGDDDTWSADAFSVDDPGTDSNTTNVTTASDRAGGSSSYA